MKGGHRPIHIQRFAPADLHADEHVQLLERRRDYRTLTFYRCFIDYSYISGGDLPRDPEALAAVLKMPTKDVVESLKFCLGRLVFPVGDRLYQARVKREVVKELKFRRDQGRVGKLGGRPPYKRVAKGEPKATVLDSKTPPSPLPTPTPVPAPTPSPAPLSQQAGEPPPTPATQEQAREIAQRVLGRPDRPPQPANPLVDRDALVHEGHAMITEIKALSDMDGTEVLLQASQWNGRGYARLDTMTDDRLAQTVHALRRWKRKLRGEDEPAVPAPEARASPPSPRATAREIQRMAEKAGGMRGDGTIPGFDRRAVERGLGRAEGDPPGPGDTRPALSGAPRKQLPPGTGAPDE